MSTRAALLVVGLGCGCDQVLGIGLTQLYDAGPDALRLLVPPPAGPPCGSGPDFSTWSLGSNVIAGFAGFPIHPSFLAADRVVFTYQGRLYESGITGGAQQILTNLKNNVAPAGGPGGDLFWYARSTIGTSGLFYAAHESGTWVAHLASFGLVGDQIEPGTAAYWGGTVRMVIMLQDDSVTQLHLVEIVSADALAWHVADTLPWSPPTTMGHLDFDPTLSSDGCLLLFAREDLPSGEIHLESARRGADGTFEPPVEIAAFSAPGIADSQPALDPTGTRLWFSRSPGGAMEALAP